MTEVVKENFIRALGEVGGSILGTVGLVFVIASVVSLQEDELSPTESFLQYFQGGQISLPILSLSAVVFAALLRRRGGLGQHIAVLLYVVVVGPIIGTALVIGFNPGFEQDKLTDPTLWMLWSFYAMLQIVWFLAIVLERSVQSFQDAAKEQEGRVERMKTKAAQHAG